MKATSERIEGKTSTFIWHFGTVGKDAERQLDAYAAWAEKEIGPLPEASRYQPKPPALPRKATPAQAAVSPLSPAPKTEAPQVPVKTILVPLESHPVNTPLPWEGECPF